MAYYSHVSTGWESLDNIIDHLRRGDNVVWQVDDIDAYRKLVSYFVNNSEAANEQVVYMRFARHAPLLAPRRNIRIYDLDVAGAFDALSAFLASTTAKGVTPEQAAGLMNAPKGIDGVLQVVF